MFLNNFSTACAVSLANFFFISVAFWSRQLCQNAANWRSEIEIKIKTKRKRERETKSQSKNKKKRGQILWRRAWLFTYMYTYIWIRYTRISEIHTIFGANKVFRSINKVMRLLRVYRRSAGSTRWWDTPHKMNTHTYREYTYIIQIVQNSFYIAPLE